jgi:hypothetical protein
MVIRRRHTMTPAVPALAAVAIYAGAALGAAETEWLSLGNQHWSPTVTSKSGIGTANATAEAKVTRKEIEGWCANWSPQDKNCVRQTLASEDAKRTYRASADCMRGRITPVDGETYTLAGTWDDSDIGAGRTRWRDASGKIVGRDNASGGLGISQQWEVLCPGPLKSPRAGSAGTTGSQSVPRGAHTPPAAQFAVGEVIEAQYGRKWVRGRVSKIREVRGAKGPEIAYDVNLENGTRGVLPAFMLRKAAPR